MGLGNGNPNEGNKGSNFNYELKTLQLLQAIAVAVEQGAGPGGLTCATLENCEVITTLQSDVAAATDTLATFEAACFVPNITVDAGATVGGESGQYQRIGNIVTCTVYFTIPSTALSASGVLIEVPIKDPASDYTASTSLIMGTITPRELPKFTNSDFTVGYADGIQFSVATLPADNIKSDYVARFSYAYDTSLC
jgi:hypothetical protein